MINCLFDCWYIPAIIFTAVVCFAGLMYWVLNGLDGKDDWADYEDWD
jgi:hypothetical protein